eukprot:3875965-Prymnesium_polylepis.2
MGHGSATQGRAARAVAARDGRGPRARGAVRRGWLVALATRRALCSGSSTRRSAGEIDRRAGDVTRRTALLRRPRRDGEGGDSEADGVERRLLRARRIPPPLLPALRRDGRAGTDGVHARKAEAEERGRRQLRGEAARAQRDEAGGRCAAARAREE